MKSSTTNQVNISPPATSEAKKHASNTKAELKEERGKGARKKESVYVDDEGSDSQNEEDIVRELVSLPQ